MGLNLLALNGTDTKAEVEVSGMELDDVFHLLQNSRRRSVLSILSDHGAIDKGELASLVAEEENGHEPNCDERKRVLVALHQTHLPKMEDHGVVETDHNVVRLTAEADPLLNVLESVEE